MTEKELRDKLRQRFADDWRLPILAGLIHIKTKDLRLIPLKPNRVQRRLMNRIWQIQQEGRPVRMVIPKARQHGISTFLEAVCYSICSFRHNTNAIIIADEVPKARGIFQMAKLMHRKMDTLVRAEIAKSNATELVFSENESQIIVSTDARSGTFHFFHSSETAYYKNADEIMLGALQTVPDLPGTMVFMESTGNGVENYFHRACKKAKAGEGQYELFFIPWFENPDYAMPASQGFTPSDGEFGNEIELKEKFHLSNDQLAWRRYIITDKCDGDLHKFMQEYPATLEECFQGTGYPVFDHDALDIMEQQGVMIPNESAWIEEKALKIVPGQGRGAYIRIWQRPAEERWKHRYVIGADTGGTYEGADYSCAYVYDRVTREVVAAIHGHFDSYIYADYLVILATWYQNAKLAIEANAWTNETDDMGISVIKNIRKRTKYKNFYTRKVVDKTDNTETTEIGWWTDHPSKQQIVDTLREYSNEWPKHKGRFNDQGLINEMRTYIVDRTKTGVTTWNASEGAKDDRVMAFGITLCVAEEMPAPYIINYERFVQEGTDDILEAI